jgi:hypothetical protein
MANNDEDDAEVDGSFVAEASSNRTVRGFGSDQKGKQQMNRTGSADHLLSGVG